MIKTLLPWFFASTAALPSTSFAAPPEPIILKASSQWQVNYADDQCRLARQFGEGDQAVLLFMDRFGPGEYFRLTIAGKLVKTGVEKGEAEIRFGPSEEEQQLSFFNGFLAKQPALVFSSSARIAAPSPAELLEIQNLPETLRAPIQPIGQERAKAVRYLRIGQPLRKPLMLETGSMRAPLVALDTCIDNLLTTWGVDVEKHKNLTRKVAPLGSPGDWIVSSDYPRDMLFVGQPAIVNFRLSVDADGKPTACHIQATTRLKAFDDAVCKSVMKRAQFRPALDAQGQPIATYYQNAVRFLIP